MIESRDLRRTEHRDPPPLRANPKHAEIEQQTREFLAGGGKIQKPQPVQLRAVAVPDRGDSRHEWRSPVPDMSPSGVTKGAAMLERLAQQAAKRERSRVAQKAKRAAERLENPPAPKVRGRDGRYCSIEALEADETLRFVK